MDLPFQAVERRTRPPFFYRLRVYRIPLSRGDERALNTSWRKGLRQKAQLPREVLQQIDTSPW
jgi:hypothetical protein